MNPLNSTVSLKFQKQLSNPIEDEVIVKSLFEFEQNHKFIADHSVEQFKAQIAQCDKKPLFNFSQD